MNFNVLSYGRPEKQLCLTKCGKDVWSRGKGTLLLAILLVFTQLLFVCVFFANIVFYMNKLIVEDL